MMSVVTYFSSRACDGLSQCETLWRMGPFQLLLSQQAHLAVLLHPAPPDGLTHTETSSTMRHSLQPKTPDICNFLLSTTLLWINVENQMFRSKHRVFY